MDRIQKFLLKLDRDRRSIYMEIFQDIRVLNLEKYDVQALSLMPISEEIFTKEYSTTLVPTPR